MEVKEQQLGFSDWERSSVRKQTRREKFLCEMEAVLPFSTLVKLIQPFCWDLCRTVPKPCKPLLDTRFWQYEASPEAAVFRDYVCQSQLKTSIQTLVLASLR